MVIVLIYFLCSILYFPLAFLQYLSFIITLYTLIVLFYIYKFANTTICNLISDAIWGHKLSAHPHYAIFASAFFLFIIPAVFPFHLRSLCLCFSWVHCISVWSVILLRGFFFNYYFFKVCCSFVIVSENWNHLKSPTFLLSAYSLHYQGYPQHSNP